MRDEGKQIKKACALFDIAGEFLRYELVTDGHINTTYRVYFLRGGAEKDYILQRVNTYVFKDPVGVMKNISSVTEFIRQKIKQKQATAKRNVLHYAKSLDGNYYAYMDDGSFWRCCRYIDNSVCFLQTDDLDVIEEAGKAFGEFQGYLSDYPVERLNIVIPHFHNTVNRYALFREAIERDEARRAQSVKDCIEGYLALEEIATRLYRLQRAGELPLRVTHNDTKISNVLFDADSKKHLSVIDLDTVMPGLVACDFGDAIRIVASTADEDERDLKRVRLNLEKYEAFTRGFSSCVANALTSSEKSTLALGAVAMTVECGMRFLTDYLNGDKYFRISSPDQNLARAQCHLVLARDMVARLDQMQAIVDKYCR